MRREEKWMKNYNLAKKYYQEHDNLLIPFYYIMKDEFGNDVNIGWWINRQRSAYKKSGPSKINKKQIDLLNKIGMVWNILNNENIITDKWMKNYKLAKKYYEEHGNLLIPQNYVMKDEIGNHVNIGIWINTQRNAYKKSGKHKINKKQIELLNKIGMVWNILNNENIITDKWKKNYNLAKKYYEEHGNLLIPFNYIMKDEIGNDVNIGIWINTQRNAYKKSGKHKINKKQIELLNKIGMVWNILNNENIITDKWMKNYKLAKKYYEEHGNLLIPQNYVVKDEIGNDVNIGIWINIQRNAYKGHGTSKINEKQIQMLDEIHMIYNVSYYKNLLKEIELEYYLYQYGLLDLKNVNELINNKILEYKDKEIVKGNALVLQKNKTLNQNEVHK